MGVHADRSAGRDGDGAQMSNLTRRIEKIEARDRPQRLIVVRQQYPGEPRESLLARWQADNPGQTWRSEDLVVILRKF